MKKEKLMQRTWFAMLLILFSSCTSTPDPETFKRTVSGPQYAEFSSSYDAVWKASVTVMGKYSLRTYDQDAGIIETEYIRGENVWIPPYKKKYIPGGYRYKLNLKLIRIKSKFGNYVRAILLKSPEIQKDFFSNPEKTPTDGLEELSLLYRIEREIEIQEFVTQKN